MAPITILLLIAAAWTPDDVQPFPMRVLADAGRELRLLLPAAESLRAHEQIELTDVPLPGGVPIDLALERVRIVRPEALVLVDGETRPAAELDSRLTMWAGRVLDEPDSDVFLAFTPTGSRGWIRRGDETVHLLAEPDGASRLVRDAELRALDLGADWTCGVAGPAGRPLPEPSGTSADGVQAFLPILECRIAIETDTQYMLQFGGDVAAAEDYVVSLYGAVSSRYREQMGIVLTIVYTAFYTGPDPWTTQETPGADGYDLFFEFQGAWDAGQAPTSEADLFYFHSGWQMLPALGAFEGACHPDWQFGTSNKMDGSTPFPISQGPLNWNFIMAAHEIGHIFGALHTHDYCPPLDQCSPAFGPCQTQQACISTGTIMSYCNQCPGFAANYTTYFHPDVADIIRGFAEDSTCLQPFDGVYATDLGAALAGGAGTPGLSITYDPGPPWLLMSFTDSPASAAATIVASPFTIDVPFKGGVLVPAPTWLFPIVTPGANDFAFSADLPADLVVSEGVDLFMQTWFVDAAGPFGLSATNAVGFELILGAPWPDPVWIAHPSNGKEYALSDPGTWDAGRAQAQAAGGDLATVDSFALNNWIVATFAAAAPDVSSVYIGFSDTTSEGTFTWASGATAGYTNWNSFQPNDDTPSGQDHAELMLQAVTLTHESNWLVPAGKWNDTVGTGWKTNRSLMERASSP